MYERTVDEKTDDHFCHGCWINENGYHEVMCVWLNCTSAVAEYRTISKVSTTYVQQIIHFDDLSAVPTVHFVD